VLTLDSNGQQYASIGFTFTFDPLNNVYCDDLTIEWYRGGELIAFKDYAPDSNKYFCENLVSNFDKVEIIFKGTNFPQNRLKLYAIEFGRGVTFYGDELSNVKASLEISPIFSSLPINVVDFSVNSITFTEYSFQDKQPLSVYFNGKLISTNFIKNAQRRSARRWDVKSEDYIGVMDRTTFAGDVYYDKNAVELLTEIFTIANVPFEISPGFEDVTIEGYIPYGTCREALKNVAFAIGAMVKTSCSDKVLITKIDTETKQTIVRERIMQGMRFDESEVITRLELTEHKYRKGGELVTAYETENASDEGVGNNIIVKFQEPLYDLEIENGEIISSSATHAVINAERRCLLTGQKYTHKTTVKKMHNTVVLVGTVENVATVAGATLVSRRNSAEVLQRCFDYLSKTRKTTAKIAERKFVDGGIPYRYGQAKYGTIKYGEIVPKEITYDKFVDIGDVITLNTDYLGDVTGQVTRQTFNLNGGVIVKETVIV
jgi:hypothetical protein